MTEELTVAREAALAAGRIILQQLGKVSARAKDDQSPVTDADLAASAEITRRLAAAFPRDAILSEEGSVPAAAERMWIVDPLDGTRDFIERTGDFAVLIGLAVAGEPLLGVLHAPAHGETYHAVRGRGTWKDGVRLHVSHRAELSTLRAAVGRLAVPANVTAFLAAAPLSVSRIGAGIKYARLCDGAIDVAVWLSGREHVWDTCAPEILVREAGGVVTDIDGAPLRYDPAALRHARGVVATNGARHAEVLELCRPWFAP